MFTMLVNDAVTDCIESHLDNSCIDQYMADASDESGLNSLLDDALFDQASADIQREITSGKVCILHCDASGDDAECKIQEAITIWG